jgi:hypothetical protein
MRARGPDVSPFHRTPTDICAGRIPDVSQDVVSSSAIITLLLPKRLPTRACASIAPAS